MSKERKEITLDTDKASFIGMAVATIVVCLLLAADVYRWAHGRWVKPMERPSGLFDWLLFLMITLAMVWFVAVFRDHTFRSLRFACACLLASFLVRGTLFFIPAGSELATALTYIRPAFGAAALIFILISLVSWFKGVVVHV